MFPYGQSYINRLRSMPAKQWVDPVTKNLICSNDTDDAGTPMYKVSFGGKVTCEGRNYTEYYRRYQDVSPLASNLADAMRLMVLGIVDYCKTKFRNPDGTWYIPDTINGADLAASIASRIQFNGTTGYVKLSTGLPEVST
jgi:hypothetical protein